MPDEKRIYSKEEVKKMAPGYRGKPENFDPSKLVKNTKPKPKSKSTLNVKPTQQEELSKATPQKNSPIWAEAIFGVDVSIRETETNVEFSNSFANLKTIVTEVTDALGTDDNQQSKHVSKELIMYYSCAMLWTRLMQIKSQRRHTRLTNTETEYLRQMSEMELNVPQPIYLYLKAIGHVQDKTGKTVYLSDHELPVTRVGRKTGYVSHHMTANTHVLFEELPSLGVCGDVLMAATLDDATPTFGFLGAEQEASQNLAGYFGSGTEWKEELRLKVKSLDVTKEKFEESVPSTRLNLRLVQYVSDYIGKLPTFRIEKVVFSKMTSDGDAAQFVRSHPTAETTQIDKSWIKKVVRPVSANAESRTTFGASYMTGFQLYKEATAGSHINWCPILIGEGEEVDQTWIDNRNARRVLPNGFNVDRFLAISDSQEHRTNSIIRRMIMTER